MQSSGDFPDGSSESIYCDDHELVALAEPADAFGPARSITTGTPGSCVGEHPIRCNASVGDSVVLLIHGLLPSGNPKVSSNTHAECNDSGPTNIPVSDHGEIGFPCDTGKSDSATCFYSVSGRGWMRVLNL